VVRAAPHPPQEMTEWLTNESPDHGGSTGDSRLPIHFRFHHYGELGTGESQQLVKVSASNSPIPWRRPRRDRGTLS